MNPLKRLVGETAIYGTSTIIARIVNFLLVPMYTRLLSPADYGVSTEFLAYIAILQVLLTLGLETGCFRFANKSDHPVKVFSNAFTTVLVVSVVFFALCVLFSDTVAVSLGNAGYAMCVVYVGGILLSDSCTAILFAQLRFEHKAVKFAIFKTIKILGEVGFNLLLFFCAPAWLAAHPDSFLLQFISPTPDYSYIIFSIFLSCVVSVLLFIPTVLHMRPGIDRRLWWAMAQYSFPIMIAGLAGVANDFVDRLLFRFFWPPAEAQAQLGVFQAGVKLAVIMNLFIQMFRYAAEPFFFAGAKDRNAPRLYADVMNHFVAFCMVIFLFVLFYIDAIGLLLGKDFRAGIDVVSVMLLAYMLLGLSFNLSMWYKLSGKTRYAISITALGLVVTLTVNLLFMRRFGYHAAAWGHLLSYLAMVIASARLGAKHYPIPYNWRKVTGYIAVAVGLYVFSQLIPYPGLWVKWPVNACLLAAYVLFWFRWEKLNIRKLLRQK
jgi:O-antigen/teichoic acid export membrane protein